MKIRLKKKYSYYTTNLSDGDPVGRSSTNYFFHHNKLLKWGELSVSKRREKVVELINKSYGGKNK